LASKQEVLDQIISVLSNFQEVFKNNKTDKKKAEGGYFVLKVTFY